MNIDKWVDENTDWVMGVDVDIQFITIEKIRKLLETHAIVPREPTEGMVEAGLNAHLESRRCKETDCYKAMIEVAENE